MIHYVGGQSMDGQFVNIGKAAKVVAETSTSGGQQPPEALPRKNFSS